ncbi:MAG TPA: SDR family NAD(P)-dependent oxidoreductase [Acidimicrobiales bacterium]
MTGAGQGLGRSYALELGRRGAKVVVNDVASVDGRPAAEVVAQAIRAEGGAAVADVHSVADPAAAVRIVDTARDAFGPVDVVVSNAGTTHFTSFEETDGDLLRAQLAVHLEGPFAAVQCAYADMVQRRFGRIVLISSATGLFGRAAGAAYAAAKASLVGLMNVVAIEGQSHGVLVNIVLPVARTTIADTATRATGRDAAVPTSAPADPRLAPPFVTPLVVYLASEHCQSTHAIYSAVAGRYARVFVATGAGWRSTNDRPPSVEALAQHWDKVNEATAFAFPASVAEEVANATSA